MNRDYPLDRVPPPVPVATREILGGGGLKLHAREWGNPEGPPLLFIHGWSQSDLCWLNQVRGDLAGTSRIVTFDLRGHGLSDKPLGPEHYTSGQLWADDMAAVIDQTSLEQPVLVAWSYGGYIVADYLRAYGDTHIGGINLVGAAAILKPPVFDHIGPGLLENAQGMCMPDLFANIAATRRFLRACTSRPLGDDELAAALAWNMVVPSAVRSALLSRELDGSDILARASVPVLVTHGRDDLIVLPSMAEHTLTACPGAAVSWYDGVGHMPFWEAPDRFDRELAGLARAARSTQPAQPGRLCRSGRATVGDGGINVGRNASPAGARRSRPGRDADGSGRRQPSVRTRASPAGRQSDEVAAQAICNPEHAARSLSMPALRARRRTSRIASRWTHEALSSILHAVD